MRTSQIQKTLLAALLPLLSIAIFGGIAEAQPAPTPTGALRGVVATAAPDGQSYNLPGASLKLKSETRSLDGVADDAGEYSFKDLLPSAYTLEVSVQGFKTATKTITVSAGETSVENISLEVADVTATVTITSADPGAGIQTNETAPAAIINQKDLQTLPLPNEQLLGCAAVSARSGAWTRWANQHERCTRQPKRDDRQQRERH